MAANGHGGARAGGGGASSRAAGGSPAASITAVAATAIGSAELPLRPQERVRLCLFDLLPLFLYRFFALVCYALLLREASLTHRTFLDLDLCDCGVGGSSGCTYRALTYDMLILSS